MAWEWVSGAVGAAGILATALTAHGGRKHSETVTKAQMAHDRALAEDARRQGRIADAYVEVLGVVAKMAHYVSQIRPVVVTNPPAPLPSVPSTDEQARAEALILAFASGEVLQRHEAWRRGVWDVIHADKAITFDMSLAAQGMPQGAHMTEIWHRLESELRPASERAREALVDAIAAELGSRTVPVPSDDAVDR